MFAIYGTWILLLIISVATIFAQHGKFEGLKIDTRTMSLSWQVHNIKYCAHIHTHTHTQSRAHTNTLKGTRHVHAYILQIVFVMPLKRTPSLIIALFKNVICIWIKNNNLQDLFSRNNQLKSNNNTHRIAYTQFNKIYFYNSMF